MQVSPAPVFQLADGRVALGGHDVLRGINFSLDPGEFVVLLGGNGSGKTTLVRALLGLAPLSDGVLKLFGKPLSKFRQWHRVGFVPQRFTAAAGVPATVDEVVMSGRIARSRLLRSFSSDDRRAADRALEAMDALGLRRRRVATLSGGEQQRILIARALAVEPDVLVLDEPVSSVDLEHQESFAATVSEMSRDGRSILLVAHALGAMAPLVDRTVTLERGEVAYEGPPKQDVADHVHVHHDPHDEVGTGRIERAAGRRL